MLALKSSKLQHAGPGNCSLLNLGRPLSPRHGPSQERLATRSDSSLTLWPMTTPRPVASGSMRLGLVILLTFFCLISTPVIIKPRRVRWETATLELRQDFFFLSLQSAHSISREECTTRQPSQKHCIFLRCLIFRASLLDRHQRNPVDGLSHTHASVRFPATLRLRFFCGIASFLYAQAI